ncbi:MAG: Conjugal transfer protein TrbL [Frondihabitans sp.]|nr:Conjugal transfer protein TrbL [Frondihabitans sp.]
MDTVFTVLHVVSGVFLVGPMAILPMVALRALRAHEAGAVAASVKSVRLFTWLSLIVVVLGFGVLGMSDGKHHPTFASTWIWLSLVAYVIAMLVNLLVVVPALRGAATAVESAQGQVAGDKPDGYSRVAAGSGVSAILLVLIVVLMVWKP